MRFVAKEISETHRPTIVILAYTSWQVGLLADLGTGVEVGGGPTGGLLIPPSLARCYYFLNKCWGKQGQSWGDTSPHPLIVIMPMHRIGKGFSDKGYAFTVGLIIAWNSYQTRPLVILTGRCLLIFYAKSAEFSHKLINNSF